SGANRGKEVVREWRFPVRAVEVPAGRGVSPEPTGNRLASVGGGALRAASAISSRARGRKRLYKYDPGHRNRGARKRAPFISSSCSVQLFVERNQGETKRAHCVVVADDVVAVLEHLEEIPGERDVAGQALGDGGVDSHQAHGDVDARTPNPSGPLESLPEL